MQLFFSKHYLSILKAIIVVSIFFFILSIWEISIGNITGFQPLLFGFGFLLYCAFNWADVFVFSLLWIIIAIILTKIKEKSFFWIVFFGYWLIRSIGEVMFSFLQQFNPHFQPWLMYAPRALLQNTWFGKFVLVRYWVVEQTIFQSFAALALFGLVYTIINIVLKKKA